VLAYLEDFDLPLQQLLILDVQVPLLDNLDGDLLLRVLVDAALDDAVLALPEGLPEVVEVEEFKEIVEAVEVLVVEVGLKTLKNFFK
jgi:hypothetical protein